jgi:hypothetical protein
MKTEPMKVEAANAPQSDEEICDFPGLPDAAEIVRIKHEIAKHWPTYISDLCATVLDSEVASPKK